MAFFTPLLPENVPSDEAVPNGPDTLLLRWLDRHSSWLLIGITILYTAVTWKLAQKRPIWFDESYTHHFARLPHLRDVWDASLTGADQTPPLFFWITQAVVHTFGDSIAVLRLPALLGFWLMSFCLYWIVAVRATPAFGLLAMLFPMTISASFYAAEARSYGLVLGFSALALLSWSTVASGRARLLSLVSLAGSLALAEACHYYAFMMAVSIAFGELVRTWERRKVDLPVWLALGGPVIPLLLSLSIIQAARSYSIGFWSKPQLLHLINYPALLLAGAVPGLAIVATLILYGWSSNHRELVQAPVRKPISRHDIATLLGLLLAPVLGLVLTRFTTGAYVSRYFLEPVLGLSVLFGVVLFRLAMRPGMVATVALLIMVGGFLTVGFSKFRDFAQEQVAFDASVSFLQPWLSKQLPIAVSSPDAWFRLNYYAPASLTSKLVYLDDPANALRILGQNSGERGLPALANIIPSSVYPYSSYVQEHPRLLLYVVRNWPDWIFTDMVEKGWRLQVLAQQGDDFLLLAERPPNGSSYIDKTGATP